MKFRNKSDVPAMTWPPLANQQTAALEALLYQQEESQYWPKRKLEQAQEKQLGAVAAYFAEHCPYFAQKLAQHHLSAADISTLQGLQKLPIMTRRELQANGAQLKASQMPKAHMPAIQVQTSGSSGEPVRVLRTAVSQLFWQAYTMRDHLWHKRDLSGTLAVIRANLKQNDAASFESWGEPASLLFKTGPAHAMPMSRTVAEQAAWLADINPDYLLVYPNNLAALLDEFAAKHITLSRLKQIRSIGETLPDSLRARAQKELNVSICDNYSSQELGNIAVQCPDSGLYHVMAESLIVELLDEEGNACREGETGRVVVTDLHNLATPLFRYDIGDYAVAAAACSCGRGLPTLQRIAGRERNMLVVDGQKRWPLVGFHHYREVAPIVQYQLIQKEALLIEVRLVAERTITASEEQRLSEVICEALGFLPQLEFTYFEGSLPKSASGKFEEFVCLI